MLCMAFRANAQVASSLTNEPVLKITQYGVWRGSQINFNDTTLHIEPAKARPTTGTDYYWLKVLVDNPYPNDEKYQLTLSLPLDYTLYMPDSSGKYWVGRNAGLGIPCLQRERGALTCVFKKASLNVLYIKMNVRRVQSYGYAIQPAVILEKQLLADNRESYLWVAWLVAVLVLGCVAGYHLYVYFHLKDQIYCWYLLMQVGGILFITAFKHFFSLFVPVAIYSVRQNPDGTMYYYDINAFLLHIGAAVILASTLQLTRCYLRTGNLLPGCDKLLRYGAWAYVAYATMPAIVTISGWYYLDNYTLLYDNVFILLLSGIILFTSLMAYKRRIRAARYFLIANLMPILLMTGLALYFIIHSAPNYLNYGSVIPELAVLSQIFPLGVALVARIRVIDDELKRKSAAIRQLEAEIEEATYKCEVIQQENELITTAIQQEKDKNEELQQQLEANQRELMGNSLYIHQKNKLLADLKSQLQDIDKLYPDARHPGLHDIKSSLKDNQYLDAEWDKFKLHFEQVHPDFFEQLESRYPALTKNELRLYAYFHIHLSTKEIAVLLNIAPASVRQAKARLNKKMNNAISGVE